MVRPRESFIPSESTTTGNVLAILAEKNREMMATKNRHSIMPSKVVGREEESLGAKYKFQEKEVTGCCFSYHEIVTLWQTVLT